MSSVHSTEQSSTFAVSSEQAVDLLLELESADFEGRIWIDSEFGKGEVFFRQGSITRASFGNDNGRPALLKMLTLSRGVWAVDACVVDEGTPIVSSIDSLTTPDELRQERWNELCAHAPPVGSVLKLSAAGAYVRDTTTGFQSSLLNSVDGRRTLMQILEESTCDPVASLELLINAIEHGLVQHVNSSNSLFPLAATAESSGLMPRLPSNSREAERGFAPTPELRGGFTRGNDNGSHAFGLPTSTPASGYGGGANFEGDASPLEQSDRGASPSEQLAVAISRPYLTRARHYIGRYEILMRIGRGGMGTVYLSRLNSEQTGFRRLVALKLLRSHLSRDTQAAQEFLDEARIAGVVHHANVVGVSDAGFHGQQPYLVMDYVEGCSLKQLMAGWPSRSPYFLLPIVIDALAGLHAVHTLKDDSGRELGLVHCDISPENMLVGVDGMCRLADFGIVRKANRVNGAAARGKLGYVSPEQINGHAFDHRADIFAMGVVLWNSLTGQSLFSGRSVEETLSNICSLEIPTPMSLGAESFAELDRIIMRALCRDPERRFRSAEDMLTELRDAALAGPGLATIRDVADWVREVAGHELALRRLAILDASRSTTAEPREFPSSYLLHPQDHDAGGNAPIALTKRVSNYPKPSTRPLVINARDNDDYDGSPRTELVTSTGGTEPRPQLYLDAPRDPMISALFYGADDVTNQGSETSANASERAVAERDKSAPVEQSAWLTRRGVIIGVALLLGSLAGYLWADISLSSSDQPPQTPATSAQ